MHPPPRHRAALALDILIALVAIGVPTLAACGGRVQSDENAGGSASPTSSPTASSTPTATPSTAPTAACDSNGVSTLDGSSCGVSFTKDIFPLLSKNGAWRCADSSCHGPVGNAQAGVNAPTIDDSSPKKAYETLAQFRGVSSEPYINGCSADPGKSAFLCNLTGSCPPQMPTDGAGVMTDVQPAQIATVKTWLACGAPLN